jgi:hypothetical protein
MYFLFSNPQKLKKFNLLQLLKKRMRKNLNQSQNILFMIIMIVGPSNLIN